ncbi:NUDIX domain-containing protein [Actinopolymorpha sp. B17G11]|uniref:NUDIX domain-containing protein n=1 Tax=unclassified Actinopolymorpha TaxID=2627063 RepID=UPI0032D925E1
MGFEGSYLWRLRQKVGNELLLLPGAEVLAFDDAERLLLMRRADTGRWSVPGGCAEPGSTFAQTAIRELEEETGLRADPSGLEPFASVSDSTTTYPNGDKVQAFVMCFAVFRWTGALTPCDGEALELSFFAPQELPDDRNPYVDEALSLWNAYRKNGRFQAC